jgi:hypothetical protein
MPNERILGMWKPIQALWKKIEGNLYFWIIGAIFSTVGGSAVLTSIWKYIQSYRGVHATDSKGLFILCLLISCLILLAWIAARREVKPRIASLAESSLQTESLAVTVLPEPSTPHSVDLRGEILEIYFYNPQSFITFEPMHVLCKVRIVNHGPDEATITDFSLEVNLGNFQRLGEMEAVPALWSIRKKNFGIAGFTFEDTPITPRLGTESDRYPKGIPRTGWLAFAFPLFGERDIEFPNAEFTLHLTDSLGGEHDIRREPQVYTRSGEIVVTSNKQLSK